MKPFLKPFISHSFKPFHIGALLAVWITGIWGLGGCDKHRSNSAEQESHRGYEYEVHRFAVLAADRLKSLEILKSKACTGANREAAQVALNLGGCLIDDQQETFDRQHANQCFSLAQTEISKVQPDDCQQEFGKLADTILLNTALVQFKEKYDSAFAGVVSAPTPSPQFDLLKASLAEHFQFLNGWMSTGLGATKRDEDLDAVTSALLRKVGRKGVSAEFAGKTYLEKLELQVPLMQAVVSPSPKMHPEFAVRLVNHLIESLQTELTPLVHVISSTCQIISCQPSQESEEIFYLVDSLGRLGTASSAGPASNEIASSQHYPEVLKTLLELLSQGRSSVSKAIVTAIQTRERKPRIDIETFNPAQFGNAWHRLRALVLQFRQMAEVYQTNRSHGVSFQMIPNELASGLDESSIRTTQERLQKIESDSSRFEARLNEAKTKNLHALVSASSHESQLLHLESQLKQRTRELSHLVQDLQGTQAAFQSAESEIAKYGDRLTDLIQSHKLSQKYGNSFSTHLEKFVVTPDQAPKGFQSVFVPGAQVEVKKGEMVKISIQGEWSPSCAISKEFPHLGQRFPMTGPEGYVATESQGNSQLASVDHFVSESESSRSDVTRSGCEGWNRTKEPGGGWGGIISAVAAIGAAAIPGGVFITAGLAIAANASGSIAESMHDRFEGSTTETSSFNRCENSSTGHSSDRGTRTADIYQKSVSSNVSFSVGMRSPYVPIPSAPVGSLLTVVSPSHSHAPTPGHYQVRAGQRQLFWVADEDSNIQFLINDCHSPESHSSGNAGQLSINVEKISSTGEVIKSLGQGMSIATAQLRSEWPKFLAMGGVTPDEKVAMRRRIESQIFTRQGETSRTPHTPHTLAEADEFRSFFDYWMDQEILQLDRQSRILQLHRQGTFLNDQIAELEAVIDHAKTEVELEKKPALWTTLDYSLTSGLIRDHMNDILDVLDQRVIPVIHVLHPNEPSTHSDQRTLQTSLPSLKSLGNEEHYLGHLTHLASVAYTKLRESQPDTHSTQTVTVVRFPKPFLKNEDGTESQNPIYRRDSKDAPLSFPVGEFDSAVQLWNALDPDAEGPSEVSIQITPELLYAGADETSLGRISCSSYAPILDTMGFVFKINQSFESSTTREGIRLPISRQKNFLFVSKQGPIQYQVLSPAKQHLEFPLVGLLHNQWHNLNTTVPEKLRHSGLAHAGSGLSPFGEFIIPVKKLRNEAATLLSDVPSQFEHSAKAHLDEITLVQLIHSKNSGTHLHYPEKCNH